MVFAHCPEAFSKKFSTINSSANNFALEKKFKTEKANSRPAKTYHQQHPPSIAIVGVVLFPWIKMRNLWPLLMDVLIKVILQREEGDIVTG